MKKSKFSPQQIPHDALGKMAPIEYAEINSLLDPSDKIKNNNFRQSSSFN